MKFYSLFYISLFLAITHIQAQQLPLFTQYITNSGLINPATISNDYWTHKVKFLYAASFRQQWTGFESSPKTFNAQALYINKKQNSDITLFYGGAILSDKLGRESTNGFYSRIGGLLLLTDDLFLTTGLTAGYVQYRIDLSNAPVFNISEPLATTSQSQGYPDLGFGIHLLKKASKSDNYFLGISMPQVLGLNLYFNRDLPTEFQIQRVRHLYITGGLRKQFNHMSLETTAWFKKTKNSPTHVDFNIRTHYKNIGWAGIGYGSSGLLFEVGYNIDKKLRVGYGIQTSTGINQNSFGLTHEINLSNGIPPPNVSERVGTIHLLTIGIGIYKHSYKFDELDFTVPGAYEVEKRFENQRLTEGTQTLIGKKANKNGIIEALESISNSNKIAPNDLIVIYFSGHGLSAGNEIGICPHDYDDSDDLITESEITEILSKSKARHKVCFIEACKSENSAGYISPKQIRSFNESRPFLPSGLTYITSTQAGQPSWGGKNGVGYFTEALLDGLDGKADRNGNKSITMQELFEYIKRTVSRVTNNEQVPQINENYIKNLEIMVLPK